MLDPLNDTRNGHFYMPGSKSAIRLNKRKYRIKLYPQILKVQATDTIHAKYDFHCSVVVFFKSMPPDYWTPYDYDQLVGYFIPTISLRKTEVRKTLHIRAT